MSAPKRWSHFWILVRVRRVYVCTCYISFNLRRYNDSSGSMILVHIIVVLQIGATSCCCVMPQKYVCLHRTETPACLRCVVVYSRSCFNEAFCYFPFGYIRGVFVHLGYSVASGMLFFNQSQPWICMKQTKTTARLIRVIRVHTPIYSRIYYDTTKLQRCCCMQWVHKYRFSILLCVCTYACARTRYTLYHTSTYFVTTNSNSSSSATAASCVCCCLPYAIYSSIDSSVLLLLDLNCIQKQQLCGAGACCRYEQGCLCCCCCCCLLLLYTAYCAYASTACCCLLHIFQNDLLPLATCFGT